MKRRRAEFEASLSPEALAGWKRALARVRKRIVRSGTTTYLACVEEE